jgi:hypothetical protein
MPNDPVDPELTRLLARAFDRAWARYYRPGRTTIAADVARPQLAKKLVELAQDGERDESRLAAGGLTHLIFLTPR